MKRNVLLILFFKFQLLNREKEREGEKGNGKTVSEEACERGHHHSRRVVFDNLDLLSMENLHGNCVTSSVWLTVWSLWRHFDLKEWMLSWKFFGFYSQTFVFAPLLFSLSQVRVLMRKKLFLRRPPVETSKHMLNIRYTDTLLGGPGLQSEAVSPLSRSIFTTGLERGRCKQDMTNELCSAS